MHPKVTSIFPIYFTLLHCIVAQESKNPIITSVNLVNKTLINLYNNPRLIFSLELRGNNFYTNMPIRISSKPQQSNSECTLSKEDFVGSLSSDYSDSPYSLNHKVLNESKCFLNVTLTCDSKMYGKHLFLCIGYQFRTSNLISLSNDEGIKWVHQGYSSQFQLGSDNLDYDYDTSKLLK